MLSMTIHIPAKVNTHVVKTLLLHDVIHWKAATVYDNFNLHF